VVLPEREMGDVDAGRTGTTCRGGGSFGVIGGGGGGGEGTSMGSFANIEGGFDFDGGHFHGRYCKAGRGGRQAVSSQGNNDVRSLDVLFCSLVPYLPLLFQGISALVFLQIDILDTD